MPFTTFRLFSCAAVCGVKDGTTRVEVTHSEFAKQIVIPGLNGIIENNSLMGHKDLLFIYYVFN